MSSLQIRKNLESSPISGVIACVCFFICSLHPIIVIIRKNIIKYLSRYSKQLTKLKQSRSRPRVFSSRTWLFNHNATLIHSPLYKELLIDAVNHIPDDFFDIAIIKKLLDDDLNSDSPRMYKLWHALIAFRCFDKTWGPCAPR